MDQVPTESSKEAAAQWYVPDADRVYCPGCVQLRLAPAIYQADGLELVFIPVNDPNRPPSLWRAMPHGAYWCPWCSDYRPATQAEAAEELRRMR